MSQQSFHQQTATGADINFTITTFSSDEIKVYVDGVEKSAGSDYNINPYNSSGQSTVDWIGTPPSSPSVVRIIRQTDVMNNGNTAVEGRATFQAGSSVKADDLNNNTKQTLRALKETQDQLVQSYDFEPQAVNTAALKDLNVTEGKIANSGVTTTKIADSAVTSAKIADGTITNADLSSTAGIAGTKVTPLFGAQNISTTGTAATGNLTVTGNIAVSGTVDGRDVATDGSKLDGVESGATADQTAAEIRTLVESATDSNVFTDADHTKLNAIEAGATADQTNAEIKTAYEANANTNEFSDAEQSKLAGIETAATADQTASEIKTLLQSDKLTLSEMNTTSLDSRYYTETEAEAKFLRQDSSETIASGATWTNSDAFVATTAAINARIIDPVSYTHLTLPTTPYV